MNENMRPDTGTVNSGGRPWQNVVLSYMKLVPLAVSLWSNLGLDGGMDKVVTVGIMIELGLSII